MAFLQSLPTEWRDAEARAIADRRVSTIPLPDGGCVLAWIEQTGGENRILARIFDAEGETLGWWVQPAGDPTPPDFAA